MYILTRKGVSRMKVLRLLGISLLIISLTSLLYAEEAKRTAKIVDIEGDVTIKPVGKSWVPAEVGMLLDEGDMVRTASDSTVLLNLNGKGQTATVDIQEESEMMLSELYGDKEEGTQKTLLELEIGKILIEAQKLHTEEERFEVETPTTIIGVRGTKFTVEVEALE
jgi:hypothetical protein